MPIAKARGITPLFDNSFWTSTGQTTRRAQILRPSICENAIFARPTDKKCYMILWHFVSDCA